MSTRVICPNCNYANSKHRRTCKQCRITLGTGLETVTVSSQLPELVSQPEASPETRIAEGRKNMTWGMLWFIGGTVVTAGTYAAASPGETYIIAWGAILFGGLQFLKGVYQYLTG